MPYTKDGLPYACGSETSEAAADSMVDDAGRLRDRVFDYVCKMSPYGTTDDEMEAAFALPHQTISPRRHELMISGKVVDSGRRRPTRSNRAATVWIQAPEGHEYVPPPPAPNPAQAQQIRTELFRMNEVAQAQGYKHHHLTALKALDAWLKHRAKG